MSVPRLLWSAMSRSFIPSKTLKPAAHNGTGTFIIRFSGKTREAREGEGVYIRPYTATSLSSSHYTEILWGVCHIECQAHLTSAQGPSTCGKQVMENSNGLLARSILIGCLHILQWHTCVRLEGYLSTVPLVLFQSARVTSSLSSNSGNWYPADSQKTLQTLAHLTVQLHERNSCIVLVLRRITGCTAYLHAVTLP